MTEVLSAPKTLFGADVAVASIAWPRETTFRISAANPASEDWLSRDRHFLRLCELLLAAPQPVLVGDALQGSQFEDPFLRSEFPKLSLMTTAWPLPGGEITLAFFNHCPDHFSTDEIELLDYFGSLIVGGPYADVEQHALCAAWR